MGHSRSPVSRSTSNSGPASPREFLEQRQGLQRQYDLEVGGLREHHHGFEEMRLERQRLREENRQLHEQMRQRAVGTPMTHAENGTLDPNFVKVPTPNQAKLSQEPFDGSEIYKGLGAGFIQWGRQFLVKIDLTEQACGFRWPERYKVSRFGEFMRGKAARYFNQRVDSWVATVPTLGHVMDKMVDAYKIVYSKKQVIKVFSERKDKCGKVGRPKAADPTQIGWNTWWNAPDLCDPEDTGICSV